MTNKLPEIGKLYIHNGYKEKVRLIDIKQEVLIRDGDLMVEIPLETFLDRYKSVEDEKPDFEARIQKLEERGYYIVGSDLKHPQEGYCRASPEIEKFFGIGKDLALFIKVSEEIKPLESEEIKEPLPKIDIEATTANLNKIFKEQEAQTIEIRAKVKDEIQLIIFGIVRQLLDSDETDEFEIGHAISDAIIKGIIPHVSINYKD